MIARPLVGAGPIGHLAAIGRGTYTWILSISAPVSASPGDLVSVEVLVQNLHSSPINIAVTASYDGVDLSFVPGYVLASGYSVKTFTASFIMPNNDVRLDIWSWYWLEPEWYWDDYGYVDITLPGVLEPEFRGFGISEYLSA